MIDDKYIEHRTPALLSRVWGQLLKRGTTVLNPFYIPSLFTRPKAIFNEICSTT